MLRMPRGRNVQASISDRMAELGRLVTQSMQDSNINVSLSPPSPSADLRELNPRMLADVQNDARLGAPGWLKLFGHKIGLLRNDELVSNPVDNVGSRHWTIPERKRRPRPAGRTSSCGIRGGPTASVDQGVGTKE